MDGEKAPRDDWRKRPEGGIGGRVLVVIAGLESALLRGFGFNGGRRTGTCGGLVTDNAERS